MKVYRYIAIFVCTLYSVLCTPVWAQLNTDRITAIGRNALYFEDYVLSIQYFNQVISLKPYLAEPYFYRAIAKIQLEDYQGALRDCNAAIERNPFSPGIYYARGYIYRQLNQPEQAEEDYTQALHFSPENRTYMLLRADTRASMGQYDTALEDIEDMLRREPQSASVWSEKGRICILKKDTLTALEAFEQAVKYDKNNAAAWSALGVTNLMLEREEEAVGVGVIAVLPVLETDHRLTLAQGDVQDAVVGEPGLAVPDGAVAADDFLNPVKIYAVQRKDGIGPVFFVQPGFDVLPGDEAALQAIGHQYIQSSFALAGLGTTLPL